VDAAVTAVFLVLVAVVVLANARVWRTLLAGGRAPGLSEEPFVAARTAGQVS
jgi:carbon starvation protein